jgi:hypothetical protein
MPAPIVTVSDVTPADPSPRAAEPIIITPVPPSTAPARAVEPILVTPTSPPVAPAPATTPAPRPAPSITERLNSQPERSAPE